MKDGQENEQRTPTAGADEPHRTGSRAKIVIGGVTVLIAALLAWSFIAHREAGETGEGGVAASASHLAREGAEVAIVLDADAASRAGIATAVLQPVNGTQTGTGAATSLLVVQVQGELVVDPARVTAVRAAMPGRLTSNRWPVLGEGVGAGRVLGQVSDAKPLIAARAGTVSRVGAQPGELVQAGQELLQLTDFGSLLARLVWRTDLNSSPPVTLRVASTTSATVGTRARLIGAAGEVDTLTRMPVYLYRLEGGWAGARPGLPIVATIPDLRSSTVGSAAAAAGNARDVLVPDGAVVQWQALAWVYVERAPGRYVRIRVTTDHPVAGGFVVSAAASGLSPGNRVVIRGAQQLLSEEFRTQLPAGEAEADEKK